MPIGIAALFVVNRNLHLHHVRREARIDWWGAAALVVALVPLLTVAEQGRVWGWDSPAVAGLLRRRRSSAWSASCSPSAGWATTR